MAKAKAKAVNYSDQDVAVLRAEYTGTDNAAEVKALAEKLGKTPNSVRAKLASLQIYVKPEAVEAEGEERTTKEVIAVAIGELVGLAEHEIDGLAKATKSALQKVLDKLA
jgi:Mn-dependent DtxR family transcriptional regulator